MKTKKYILLVLLAGLFTTGFFAQRVNNLILPTAQEKNLLDKEILQPFSPEETRIIEQRFQNKILQSQKEVAVPKGWVNVNALMTEGDYIPRSTSSKARLLGNYIYPDSTIMINYTNGSQRVQWMGMGQALNFNNEAFSLAAPDRRFVTSRDTVNIDSLSFSATILQDTSKGNIDTVIVYYGSIARTRARNGWYLGAFTGRPDAENNDTTIYPALTTTSSKSHGYFATVKDIPNLKVVKVPVDTGTRVISINTPGLKLTNDSLLYYHVYFKPKEYANFNDTVISWNKQGQTALDAKGSCLILSMLTQRTANPSGNVRKRYFRDLNSKDNDNFSWTFTTSDWAESRYGSRNYPASYLTRAPYTLVYFGGNSTLSTLEKQAPKFSIYPNPTQKSLNIHFKEHLGGNKTIEVIDMVGRVVNTYTTRANQYKIDDLDVLTNGIYFVKISAENGTSTTRRLIITH